MCDFPARMLAQLAYKTANPTGPLFGKNVAYAYSTIKHIIDMGREHEDFSGCPCLQEALQKLGLDDERSVNTDALAAIPTTYQGVLFRSRLEARWAAFFDLAGWKWDYEPVDFKGWIPDFRVTIPCCHTECRGNHVLLVEVKPHTSIDKFKNTTEFRYAMQGYGAGLDCDAVALFGGTPDVSYWQMTHGTGGGFQNISDWVTDWLTSWREAGNIVQWNKPEQPPKKQPATASDERPPMTLPRTKYR